MIVYGSKRYIGTTFDSGEAIGMISWTNIGHVVDNSIRQYSTTVVRYTWATFGTR